MGRPTKPVDQSTYAGRFAARLRELRERKGLTGEEMAESITNAGYECPKNTFYNWEGGLRSPPYNAIPAIAKAFGIKPRTVFPES